MSVYCYSETLKNVLYQLTLDLKYKNMKIDLMEHFPFFKKGFLLIGGEINMLFKLCSSSKNNHYVDLMIVFLILLPKIVILLKI